MQTYIQCINTNTNYSSKPYTHVYINEERLPQWLYPKHYVGIQNAFIHSFIHTYTRTVDPSGLHMVSPMWFHFTLEEELHHILAA